MESCRCDHHSHICLEGILLLLLLFLYWAGDIFCPLKLGRFPQSRWFQVLPSSWGYLISTMYAKPRAHTQEKTKSMKLKSVVCVPLTGLKGIEKNNDFRFSCRSSKHSHHPILCFPLFGPAPNSKLLIIWKRVFFVKTSREGLEQHKDV